MTRRILIILTTGAALGIIVLVIHPVHSSFLSAVLSLCAFGFWLGMVIVFWRAKVWRCVLVLAPVLFAIPFALPAKPIDAEALREDYLGRMRGFEGAWYHWGGENRFGIDCSGLMRRAYRDALLSQGLRRGNGRACRLFLEQWRYDTSAKALGEGYRHFTVPMGIAGKIQEMDYAGLTPGDLAVTTSGAHILAYLGGNRWIQADPGEGKVIILDGREDENIWFDAPVTIHRWKELD